MGSGGSCGHGGGGEETVTLPPRRSQPLQCSRRYTRTSFSAHEYAALCRLPPADHFAAFFATWSRKEAFIKATGEGVSQLEDFDVTVRADEPARLLRVPGPPPAHARWWILDLPAIPAYAAALVVEGDGLRVDCWDWPPG